MTKPEAVDVEEAPNATLVEPLLPSAPPDEEEQAEAEPVVVLASDPSVEHGTCGL